MTPDDLAVLLKWSYAAPDGGGWLPAAARDLRIADRNLRGMLSGQVAIPSTVAEVVCILAAARSRLKGWEDRWTALVDDLTPSIASTCEQWRARLAA